MKTQLFVLLKHGLYSEVVLILRRSQSEVKIYLWFYCILPPRLIYNTRSTIYEACVLYAGAVS